MQTAVESMPPKLGLRGAGTILLTFFLLYVVTALILALIIQHNEEWISATELFRGTTVTSQLISGGAMRLADSWLLLIVTLVGLKSYHPRESIRDLLMLYGFQLSPNKVQMLVSFLVGVVLVLIFARIVIPLVTGSDSLIPNPASQINVLPMWFKLAIAVTAFSITPIAEEFMFRGVLFIGFRESFGTAIAAVAASVIFIAVHPENLSSGNAITHFLLVAFSALLMLVRIRSKGLYLPVMLHAGFNFSSVFLA